MTTLKEALARTARASCLSVTHPLFGMADLV